MGLPRNKMPSTQRKCIGGWPKNCFLFTLNWEMEIPLNEWPHNTKQLWGLKHICCTSWQMSYGVKIGMHNILWTLQPICNLQSDSYHAWAEFKSKKNCSTPCAHWWGLHMIRLHLMNVIKGNHK
jgi:hypothetical protein